MAKIETNHSYTPKTMDELLSTYEGLKKKGNVSHITISATYTKDDVERFGINWMGETDIPGATK